MKKIASRQIALILLIVLPLVFSGMVVAQPAPIGDILYKQTECFDSNPTAGATSGLGTETGTINDVFDGDLNTNLNFIYGATAAGYAQVSAFKKPTDNGLTDFTVTFVDIKMDYRALATAASDDQYRIIAYVDPSPTAIILQDWVHGTNITAGTSALYPPGISANAAVRTWSNVAEPNDGVWTWTDMANLKVQVEIQVVGGNNFQRIYVHEIWATAYSTPYPEPGTISVQTPLVGGLIAGDLFYVDIYVTNVVKLWAYQFVLYFDPAILTPIEYMSYSPFVSSYPSEIGPNYVAVAYKTYDGDPIGFTGSTPVSRIYFSVASDGASLLSLQGTVESDIYGQPVGLTARSGVFATSLVRDVAVTAISVNSSSVLPPSQIMKINATVSNQGSVTETINVTAFYGSTPIETMTVADLTAGGSRNLDFMWNATGVALGSYEVKVEADTVFGEMNTENNVRVFGNVIIGRHDIAVTNIIRAYSNGTVVPVDGLLNVTRVDVVNINVTVENLGTFSETFNLTLVWINKYRIENKTNVQLDPGVSRNLTFVWDTDYTSPEWSFSLDRWGRPDNFTRGDLRAIATPKWYISGATATVNATGVPGEVGWGYNFLDNNDLTDGEVRVNRDFLAPTAKFLGNPMNAFVTQPVLLKSLSTTPTGTTIVTYRWDFGDGNITETGSSNITHAYAAVGSYYVSLFVFNDLGKRGRIKIPQIGAPSGPVVVTLRNVKIVSVDVSPTTAVVGENVTIQVTLKNERADDENLWGTSSKKNITVYFGNTIAARVPAPDLGSVESVTSQKTLKINWTTPGWTPGIDTIKVVLDDLPFETSFADNTMTFATQVTLQWHNIKITDITPSKTEASTGESVTVSVTVLNIGNYSETFTVTVYANDTAIGSPQTVTGLAAGASKVLDFTWDTSGLNSGIYVFKAVASNVTLEAVTSDNTFAAGQVTLSPPSNMLMYIIIGAVAAIAVVAVVGVYFLKFRKPKQKP